MRLLVGLGNSKRLPLSHFRRMFLFHTPEIHQKAKDFLAFPGSIKWEHLPERLPIYGQCPYHVENTQLIYAAT